MSKINQFSATEKLAILQELETGRVPLKNDIDSYIYFYNYERLQAKLNSLSPMEFRTKAA